MAQGWGGDKCREEGLKCWHTGVRRGPAGRWGRACRKARLPMRGGGPPGRGPLRLGCGGGEAKVPPPPLPPVPLPPPLPGAPPVMPAHSLPVLRACLQMTHMQPSLQHMHEGVGQQACHTIILEDWQQVDQMAECPTRCACVGAETGAKAATAEH